MSGWRPCPKCGREPKTYQFTSDMDFLGPRTKYRAVCCDIDIRTEDPYETERQWNEYVDTYIKDREKEVILENSTNYNDVSEKLTSNINEGEDKMKDSDTIRAHVLHMKKCKYCGENLKEIFSYDDRTCSTTYSCDCEGAKEQKRLEEAIKKAKQRVEDLEHALQQHKASSLYNKKYNALKTALYELEQSHEDIGQQSREVVPV